MKKALAALLASFVGLFGYQIVDKALEARVDNLEYQVSSQQEEIESLHGIGKYSMSSSIAPSSSSPIESSTDSGTPTLNPPTTVPFSRPQYDYNSFTTRPNYGWTDPFYTEQNYTSCINDNPLSQDIIIYMTCDDDSYNEYNNSYYYHQISPGTNVSSNDFPIYITSLKTYIYAKEDVTREYYDSNMSTTSEYYYTKYRVVYMVEGHTDPAYAGYNISFNSSYSNSATINNDGTFSFTFSSIYGFKEPPGEIDIALRYARMWKD